MTQLALVIDLNVCVGCHACVTSCKQWNTSGTAGALVDLNPYGADPNGTFFLATGFHGLHVTGGLIAFLLMLGRTYMARKFTHEQAVHAIVTSYYWHFVDAIWIILFFALYILR